MLSHIIRISAQFEREHGCRPTLLTLHPKHFQALQAQLDGQFGMDYFCTRLGMHIVLSSETVHPSVYAKTSYNSQVQTPRMATRV